ncbi:AP-3 complex subunit delta [Trypanosoma theileri]|uniref:AP-3 complex subunit delta n=1 Tax=Trypanosoma theileri TaxID=67003 RepID=A0A1X0NNX5_9TRYP|nr:AP-3 complex subunit delta [Trypanosoma theileri]ORC86414.1 AP-3 complex subunit delta [Trypanosoma theileri]
MAEATKVAGQILFQNSLAEVVRKLRSTSKSEAEVLEQCIADTKKEITSTVQSVKVTAVLKAVYFSMLGHSAAYGAFNIIEVMADRVFNNKRIGYMAACLTFTPKTDVLPLLTALLKRDLSSANQYEVGFALYCISSVCTLDLARDLVVDVVNLLNHPRNYVRKKAVLSLYRIFFAYPDSLRPTYPRLREKLDGNSERCDNDPSVRGAVVSVLCELARRNPANFLGLAVPFFSMLYTVHSNWTLIKIVKVFGYFASLEPRLGKKLVEPITNLIETTGAKSVQYECILAVANGMSKVPSLTKLAAEKMRLFVEDTDQNLKYLGLDAMSRMVRDNPKLLSEYRDIILACLDDIDSTIRKKTLEVLRGLVTRKNIVSTINKMMERCVRSPPDEDWSNRVIETVIEIAQIDDYALIQDFEWYTSILIDISLVNLSTYQHGDLVQRELVTVLTRVNAVRQFGINALSHFFSNSNLLNCDPTRSTQWEVIKGAAFLCGEYPYWLRDKRLTCSQLLSDHIAILPPEAQVLCVTAVGKIAAYIHQPSPRHLTLVNGEEEFALPEDPVTDEEIRAVILPPTRSSDQEQTPPNGKGGDIHSHSHSHSRSPQRTENTQFPHVALQLFQHSIYPDVQERAQLVFHHIVVNPDVGPRFYAEELRPVAAGAQAAVLPPDDLDISEPFCRQMPELLRLPETEAYSSNDENEKEEDEEDDFDEVIASGLGGFVGDDEVRRRQRQKEQKRKEQQRRGEVAPFYISGASLTREEPPVEVQLEAITAASLQLQDPTNSPYNNNNNNNNNNQRSQSQQQQQQQNLPRKTQTINRDLSRPSNYVAPTQTRRRPEELMEDEATRLFRNVDVTRALTADERLPETVPYAQLLQSRKREEDNNKNINNKTAAAEAAAELFDPVTLLDERYLRVMLYMESCRVRKEGISLTVTVEVSNMASSNSAYNVTLCFQPDGKNYTENGILLELIEPEDTTTNTTTITKHKKDHNNGNNNKDDNDEKKDKNSDSSKNDTEKGVLHIADRLKGSSSVRKKMNIKFISQLPDSLVEPLEFKISFVREKKPVNHSMFLPLQYAYFAKVPKDDMKSSEFMEEVLEKSLVDAPVFSSFVPMDLSRVQLVLPMLLSKLRLRNIDVFRDITSFRGVLHVRKSSSSSTATSKAHVAVLLQEDTLDGEKGLTIAAKSHQSCLTELLLQDIATLLLQ